MKPKHKIYTLVFALFFSIILFFVFYLINKRQYNNQLKLKNTTNDLSIEIQNLQILQNYIIIDKCEYNKNNFNVELIKKNEHIKNLLNQFNKKDRKSYSQINEINKIFVQQDELLDSFIYNRTNRNISKVIIFNEKLTNTYKDFDVEVSSLDKKLKTKIKQSNTTEIISIVSFLLIFILIMTLLLFISKLQFVNPLSKTIASLDKKPKLKDKQHVLLPEIKHNSIVNLLNKKINTVYNFYTKQNKSLLDKNKLLSQQFSNLQFSTEIGRFVLNKLNIEKIVLDVYNELGNIFDINTFTIGLYKNTDNNMEVWKINSINEKLQKNHLPLDASDSLSVYCLKNSKEIFINDFKKEYKKYHINPAKSLSLNKSMIYLPLISLTDRTIGILSVKSKQRNAYKEFHLRILRNLSIFIVTAIENSKMYEKLNSQTQEISERNEALNQQKEEISTLARQLEEQFDAVQISEKKLINIINFIPDPLMVLDSKGCVVIWNKSMENLTGVRAEHVIGIGEYEHSLAFYETRRPMLADILLYPMQEIEDQYNSFHKSENFISGEGYVPLLDKTLWGSASILYDGEGAISGAIQISRDVTERKKQSNQITQQKEEILVKQSELERVVKELKVTNTFIEEINKDLERLSLVASKTDNSVVILDKDFHIEWVNKAFYKLHKLTKRQFMKQRGKNWIVASYHPNIKEIINNTIENKKSSVYISNFILPNKENRWIQTTLTPIYGNKDYLKNLIVIQTNITKTKKAEKEIVLQNKKIRHSIKYARRIQTAVLPPKKQIDRTLADYFILYKPRDIVSGDFYWITRKETKIMIAIADSTGHGVPGAFMSMLGISFLNEITNKLFEKDGAKGLQADNILNHLKTEVIRALHQKKDAQTKDGFDLSFCIFDLDTKYLQYAGANNPLIIIRDKDSNEQIDISKKYIKNIENEDAHLYEIIADKTAIGYTNKAIQSFQNKEFHTKPGDTIYMFTDGYIDQFGGEKGRKFLISNFRKLLLNIHTKPMKEQERILNDTLRDWMAHQRDDKREHYQIDDILIMGMKF